jgi:hypothetical protein
METKEVTKSAFTLPKDIVIVKFIKRKMGMSANVDENHVISGGMLSGSKKKFCAPLQRNGSVANILSPEEKTHLEELTNLNLSVYGDFWTTFFVSLYKDDANNRFDMSNPMDYISIKILESLKNDIAHSWNDRNKKQTYQFVITRSDEEFKEKKVKLDTKKQAFKLYGKIEDDKEKLIGILKLLTNQPISADSKLEWIQGKVEEYLDSMPSSFLSILEDKSFETKVLINKGVDSGLIIRNANKYATVDGLDLCENGEIASFDNAVKYLEHPKNQEVRLLIEARIDNSK